MTQLDLLYPHTPGSKRDGTSREAAQSIAPRAETLRTKALAMIRKHNGLTADECAAVLNESVLAIRPRITELSVLKLIRDSGRVRKNASGRKAIVWVT